MLPVGPVAGQVDAKIRMVQSAVTTREPRKSVIMLEAICATVSGRLKRIASLILRIRLMNSSLSVRASLAGLRGTAVGSLTLACHTAGCNTGANAYTSDYFSDTSFEPQLKCNWQVMEYLSSCVFQLEDARCARCGPETIKRGGRKSDVRLSKWIEWKSERCG